MPEKENPISLYFHIPFCTAKCGYCDFNSYELQNLIERKQVHDKNWASEYTDALIIEIEGRVEELQLAGRKVQSVFFVGTEFSDKLALICTSKTFSPSIK